ncbi:MAG: serine/threonine-protein kinase [Granulosicoccaceae bacterium]
MPATIDKSNAVKHPAEDSKRASKRVRDAAPTVAATEGSEDVAPKAKAPLRIKPLDIVVPDEIKRYTIGAKIGSGTCGVVHLALDNVLNREVAVKLSPIGEAHASSGKLPGAQRAYQTEIIAAGKLAHPNIVTVFDAGQYEELNYLVMEAVEGESLKEYGKGKAPLPIYRSLEIIVECCKALDYSHKQGILHRDIKPANIMLADDGSAKLLDFGIAIGLTGAEGMNNQGPTLGTPNYMSPEQILGKTLTPASDFYSLATVLFELLTSRQLFKAQKVKQLFNIVVHKDAPLLHEVKSDLPADLSRIVSRALAKNPRQRFQNGKALVAALTPFIERFRIIEQRPAAQQRFIRQLKQQLFFTSFTEVEIAQLLEVIKVRTYAKGEKLITAGSVDRDLLIVSRGAVRVSENGDLLRLCSEGECVGELSFIHGAAETKDVVALSEVSALEVSADSLNDLPPKVHLHYYRQISDVLLERLANEGKLMLDYTL